MKRYIERIRGSKEIQLVLIGALIWNVTVYFGTRLVAWSWPHHDITTTFDMRFPFMPWTIVIYIGSYLFWVVNYCICAVQDRQERHRFFCADWMAKIIALIIFLTFPTTNLRPEITGNGLWDVSMKLLYWVDRPDNLFPSLHCLVSWLCWIGVRKRKDVSVFYRYGSLLIAVAICLSTMTTKQHVLVDVIGGIALAEICYAAAGASKIRGVYSALIARLLRRLNRFKKIKTTK